MLQYPRLYQRFQNFTCKLNQFACEIGIATIFTRFWKKFRGVIFPVIQMNDCPTMTGKGQQWGNHREYSSQGFHGSWIISCNPSPMRLYLIEEEER